MILDWILELCELKSRIYIKSIINHYSICIYVYIYIIIYIYIYIYTLSYYRSLSYFYFYYIAVDLKKNNPHASIRKSPMGRLERHQDVTRWAQQG